MLGGVVHPDPGTAGHLDPLRGELVQAGRLAGGPGQQPVQGLPGIDPPEVGAAPGAGQLGLQPVVGAVDQGLVVLYLGPGSAERPVQEPEAGAERLRVGGPAQQSEPFAAQAVEEGGPYERGVGGAERAGGELDRPEAVDGAGEEVPALPADLLAVAPQVRGGGEGGAVVDDGGHADAGGCGVRGPVGDGHGQPGRLPQR